MIPATHPFYPQILRILRLFSRPRRPVILSGFGLSAIAFGFRAPTQHKRTKTKAILLLTIRRPLGHRPTHPSPPAPTPCCCWNNERHHWDCGWLLGVLWGAFSRHISYTIEAKSKTSLERLPPPAIHVCVGCIFWIDETIRGPLGGPPVEHFPCGGFPVR